MQTLQEGIFTLAYDKLYRIKSYKPFEIIFYGSRARGDFTEFSDYNFYLLAHPTDQLNSGFVNEIAHALEYLESESAVSLVAGDVDSFQMRIKLFDPTVIHVCELGKLFYGDGEFIKICQEWQEVKKRPLQIDSLISFLENRYKFYKSLSPRGNKEDITRIERILSLNIQIWILKNIEDISLTELYYLDIPSRMLSLARTVYRSNSTKEFDLMLSIYEEIHKLKQILRIISTDYKEKIEKIKDSISQIQDLSKILENIL
ncbi:MAG: hypothetical protein H7A23_09920 [Leptospiraceae bacterium]|nr:hypothetical protein [Leptospiraceae bacterium]MCP5494861.1 hypothetical protein [Leptospiraceae bacterium]